MTDDHNLNVVMGQGFYWPNMLGFLWTLDNLLFSVSFLGCLWYLLLQLLLYLSYYFYFFPTYEFNLFASDSKFGVLHFY